MAVWTYVLKLNSYSSRRKIFCDHGEFGEFYVFLKKKELLKKSKI